MLSSLYANPSSPCLVSITIPSLSAEMSLPLTLSPAASLSFTYSPSAFLKCTGFISLRSIPGEDISSLYA